MSRTASTLAKGAVVLLVFALVFVFVNRRKPDKSGVEAGDIAATSPAPTAVASEERPPTAIPRLTDATLKNPYAYIPPQCYTKTEDEAGRVSNPCFVCHTRSRPPNYIKDAGLQLEYDFAKAARNNPWSNLFVDRTSAIASISDDEMLRRVRESNYKDAHGELVLARRLRDLPAEWDANGDGKWAGYIPDAYFHFDEGGFDYDPQGKPTGWRAFAYYPFPGTFWPTNGSAGDVLIRLPEPFRQNAAGNPDEIAYRINLAIVEALIARADVEIDAIDENGYGVDLDQDGGLGRATRVTYVSVPEGEHKMRFVGGARALEESGALRVHKGLYPQGTEFLHSVRYLDVQGQQVGMAARMKELRYAVKRSWFSLGELDALAASETKEKHDFPDRLRSPLGDFEQGVNNGQGWRYQGFIEDAEGRLRPQSFEETAFCIGCHGGIGGNADGIFSFARKLPSSGHARGFFHWSQRGLSGIAEPIRGDGRPEYTVYLEENHAGDEFRGNREVIERFFDERGGLKQSEVERLHADVSVLLLPSPARALALDKAYLAVVKEQSYRLGRDAVIAPLENVHKKLEEGAVTGVDEPVEPIWAE